MRKPRLPSYRHHKPSGQAVVTLNGKDYYLGPHGSPESQSTYQRLLAEHLVKGSQPIAKSVDNPNAEITVSFVLAKYRAFIESNDSPYWKCGKLTAQVDRITRAIDPLCKLYGQTSAEKFGTDELKAVRAHMISSKWARTYINSLVGCIKTCWGWAAGERLVPASQAMALRMVKGLREGRPDVREPPRIVPVPWSIVEATLPHAHAGLASMIQLQHLTGMRPCELCAIGWSHINRDGRLPDGLRLKGVWVYVVPAEANKLAHKNRDRIVCLGPQAQAILERYKHRPVASTIFSPNEAAKEWLLSHGRKVKLRRKRAPGEQYDSLAYYHSVERAIRRADRAVREAASKKAIEDGTDQPNAGMVFVQAWHPNQLRHLRATEVRSRYGSDAARVVLGHTLPGITGRYAEADLRKAARVMREIG